MAIVKKCKYRGQGIEIISEKESSVLIVVGRKDTGDLEAQIRGSRFAWNIRLISVDALSRLMSLKEEFENPEIIKRISSILIPREFTKLDEIINLVFSTAEDVKDDDGGFRMIRKDDVLSINSENFELITK